MGKLEGFSIMNNYYLWNEFLAIVNEAGIHATPDYNTLRDVRRDDRLPPNPATAYKAYFSTWANLRGRPEPKQRPRKYRPPTAEKALEMAYDSYVRTLTNQGRMPLNMAEWVAHRAKKDAQNLAKQTPKYTCHGTTEDGFVDLRVDGKSIYM